MPALPDPNEVGIRNPAERNAAAFRCCPRCGAATLQPAEGKAMACRACRFKFFLNTATAVGALIHDAEGRLLVTIRQHDPGAGTWGLPGGFVDPGESAEEALRREVREEVRLELDSLKYFCSLPNLYPYAGVDYVTCDLMFLCTVRSTSDAAAGDEVSDFMWLPRTGIRPERFGMPSMRRLMRCYLDSTPGAT